MNNELNTEHYQASQRVSGTAWLGSIGQPVFPEKGHLRLQIFPRDGTRIISVQAFGFGVLRQWEPQRKAFQYGYFPMVPWANRLSDATLTVGEKQCVLPANKPPHVLHGMACYSSWEIVEYKADTSRLRMPLGASWPWQGEVLQTLTLEGGALILRLEIHTMSEVFPASAGWYPWLVKQLGQQNKEDKLLIRLKVDWQEEAGNNELPTGNKISPQSDSWGDCSGLSDGLSVRL